MDDVAEAGTLSAQYDDLWREVQHAVELRKQVLGRLSLGPRWVYRGSLRHDPAGVTPGEVRKRMDDEATPEERADPLFEAVTARYWLESLAQRVRARFHLDAEMLAALLAIHEARQGSTFKLFSRVSFAALAAIAVTAFGFIASQVPKESFAELGGQAAYGWYRLGLVAFLVISLVMLAVLSILVRRKLPSVVSTEITGYILALCAVLPSVPTDRAHPTAGG